MGLSIAIFGGITVAVIVIILGVIFAISYQINSESLANTDAFELQNSLLKTDMDIKLISAISGDTEINFLLINNGSTKLWNYKDFDMIITYDADILGTKTRITEQFTFNETASFPFGERFARPDGVIGWDAAGMGNMATGPNPCANNFSWLCIDEIIQNDADYIEFKALDDNENNVLNYTLSDVNDPGTDANHVVRYTYREENVGTANPDLIVTLFQGNTQIATWTESSQLPAAFTLATKLLTLGEAGSITDYRDLILEFNASCNGCPIGMMAIEERVSVSWVEMEIPSTVLLLPGLQPKEWGISIIFPDVLDPGLLNTQESSIIEAILSYPIFANGLLEITISTDNGKVISDSIIVT